MKLVNLTPYNAVLRINGRDVTIPPSGQVARLEITGAQYYMPVETDTGTGYVPVYHVINRLRGLPDPADDTIYLVSPHIAKAAARLGRTDVMTTVHNAVVERGLQILETVQVR